jgi:hypothetical protein
MFPAFTWSQIEGFGIDGICNGKYLDLVFSLLLKVLIDGCFVFSLLQHHVLPAAARAGKWQYQRPPRMYASW